MLQVNEVATKKKKKRSKEQQHSVFSCLGKFFMLQNILQCCYAIRQANTVECRWFKLNISNLKSKHTKTGQK